MAPAKGSKAMKTAQRVEQASVEPVQAVQNLEQASVKPCERVQRPEDAAVESPARQHTEDAFVDANETVQQFVDAIETVQQIEGASVETPETKPKVDGSVDPLEIGQHTGDASVKVATTQKSGITQAVRVYSIEVRNCVMEIVGSVGDKILMIKATVYAMGSGPVGKVKQMSLSAQATGALYLGKAATTLKAKTAFLQDGYVYITSTVEGRVLYLKAKVAEPIKACAISLQESSGKIIHPVLQKFKPVYVKVHGGITDLIGTIGKRIVVIRARMLETSTSMRAWTLESLSGARAVLVGYTSPVVNKIVALQQSAASRVDHIFISIRDGAIHLRGAVGEKTLPLRTKLSQGWEAATRTPIALAGKLIEIVSNAYGKTCDKLKVMQCSIKDGFLYIFGLFKDRLVVMRIGIVEFADHVQSRSLELYAATHLRLAGACSGAKTAILNATETTRNRASEAGTNICNLAANPDARAAAAGGVALGASGAATGFVAGGAVGAVCALPAAFFTFGLSIPVGAMVGAGAGGVVGGSAGTVAGSIAGYKAHKEKDTIGKSIRGAFERAKAQKVKTVDSASNLQAVLTASIRGHIGGSA